MNEAVIQGKKEIALLEDGALVGYRKLSEEAAQTGDVFWARIQAAAPGDGNSCFMDIGLPENAFCSDRGQLPQGKMLPVTVVSAAHDNKPARVSTGITLAGRLAVLSSDQGLCAVSGKIEDFSERERLRALAERIRREDLSVPGLILRTEAAGSSEEAIREDIGRLGVLWKEIQSGKDSPGRIFRQDPYRAFLSRLRPIDSLVTDNTEVYEELRTFYPQIRYRNHGEYSLFDVKQISSQLSSLTGRRVWLPSGGNIVLEKTEALTVIDVNSGKAVGHKAAPLAVNLEAACEIMRQLRLRDLGGAVVCDFIGMKADEGEKVLETLKTLAKKDFAKPRVYGFTALGLVEISRKRS